MNLEVVFNVVLIEGGFLVVATLFGCGGRRVRGRVVGAGDMRGLARVVTALRVVDGRTVKWRTGDTRLVDVVVDPRVVVVVVVAREEVGVEEEGVKTVEKRVVLLVVVIVVVTLSGKVSLIGIL